jgi:hypothetical protein
MLKKYSEQISLPTENIKITPSDKSLQTILNYSKSVTAVKSKEKRILINLN